MAATKYIVSATNTHPNTAERARKEGAVRLAEMRARAEGYTAAVTVTTTAGAVVHTTQVRAPKTGNRGTRRAPVAVAAVEGWEVLYEFPKLACEIIRSTGEGKARYAMYCQTHNYTHPLAKLTDDRPLRREGTWCPECVEHNGPTAAVAARKRAKVTA